MDFVVLGWCKAKKFKTSSLGPVSVHCASEAAAVGDVENVADGRVHVGKLLRDDFGVLGKYIGNLGPRALDILHFDCIQPKDLGYFYF